MAKKTSFEENIEELARREGKNKLEERKKEREETTTSNIFLFITMHIIEEFLTQCLGKVGRTLVSLAGDNRTVLHDR